MGYKIPKKETPPSKKLEKNPAEEDGGVAKGSDTKKKEDSIQEKKRPSEKMIHRKQKPEEVPDFLVIDSSIIPQERDLRYLDKGYDYQSKEQWKADYVFLKLQLKQAKAQVVVKIFKTDTISKPSNFLRRFWAATGVPKTKPITDVVADILNSKNG